MHPSQINQFLRGKNRSPCIIAAAIDTVLTIVNTAVCHQNFQQCDAASVCGKSVAASCQRRGGVANVPRARSAPCAAGCAGGIIFGGIGKNRQFLQQIHGRSAYSCHAAGMPSGRALDDIDDAEQLCGDDRNAQYGEEESPTCHSNIPQSNKCTVYGITITRTNVLVK